MTQPTRAQTRQFITKYFDDNELNNLCFDYFPPVEDQFTIGMVKTQKITLLIKYAETRGVYKELLAAIGRERESAYSEVFAIDPEPIKPQNLIKVKLKRNSKQIFLSHSGKDRSFAIELADKLKAEGWQIWMAPDSIQPGEKWVEAINRGLEESGIFLLLITPDAVASKWVTLETNTAINLDTRGTMQFVPLEVTPADTPVLWSAFQWIPFSDMSDKSFGNLMAVLNREKLKHQESALKVEAKPTKATKTEVALEKPNLPMLYIAAEKAYEIGDWEEALKLFEQIVTADKKGLWGENAQKEIDRIKVEQAEIVRNAERDAEYAEVNALAKQNKKVGRIAWQLFIEKYGDFDPQDLTALLAPPKPKIVLPNLFDWIEILGKDYSISKYPVTNGQYALFVKDGGYKQDKWWTAEGVGKRNGEKWSEPRYWDDPKWNGESYPIVGVSWFEAVAFCNWLSEKQGQTIMLPTEEQWQYAAQGDDGRKYPWGNKWVDSKCNHNVGEKGIGKTTPVTQYEGKVDSPFGVVDMSGNVWEWCLTDYDKKTNDVDATAEYRVLRGGSWNYNNGEFFAVSDRDRVNPYFRRYDVGFRVALSS
ncbi:MAG: hypothetical protein ACI85U_000686 [Candidatus Promineifilaceae bacterium]|jgi:hypothetical protein